MICVTKSLDVHLKLTHYKSTTLQLKKEKEKRYSVKGHIFTAAVSLTSQCRRPGLDPWVGKIPWRRKWQPTPVFLPGESHGRRILVGYSSWGRKESDTTERLHFHCATEPSPFGEET